MSTLAPYGALPSGELVKESSSVALACRIAATPGSKNAPTLSTDWFLEDRVRDDDEETMVTSVGDDSAPSIIVPGSPLNSPAASYPPSTVSDMDSKVRALAGKLENLSSQGPTPPSLQAVTIPDGKTAPAERVTAVLPLFPYGLVKHNPAQSWSATPDNHRHSLSNALSPREELARSEPWAQTIKTASSTPAQRVFTRHAMLRDSDARTDY
ncbi:hypothetical protein Tdes44962_MAKER02399 [Teratosphaeria destructans]|uniref:Uncharacterized protein n=1 Tax=Teratosphaeria destructans TaxID=418781 RepID=A0A9W7STX6_9PEZI|nr:hypothetical protein Tdes44962_MAKER02399 [Teratosphaeria destructans]